MPPATTQVQLIAAVATLTVEVENLRQTVLELRKDVHNVTEFKNKSMYIATGVAIAFSAIGAMLSKAWEVFKS